MLENGAYIWENVSGKWIIHLGKCLWKMDHTFEKMSLENGSYILENVSRKCLWKMDHTLGKMSLENGSYIWENVSEKWIIHFGKGV